MTVCKGCGNTDKEMWLSDKGLCSVCNYDLYKWEKQNLYRQAECMICYSDIMAPKVDDVKCLWEDEGYSGSPVCFECAEILKGLVPEKLKYAFEKKLSQEPKIKKPKMGLDRWF